MNKAKIACLAAFLSLASLAVKAQPNGGTNGGGNGGGGEAPIDGGVSMLVAGIAAYGAKKIRERREAVASKEV